MTRIDTPRNRHARAGRAHSHTRFLVRNVAVSADEIRAWQLGPLFGRAEQNGRTRRSERS